MGEVRELTQKIKHKALELGFARVGVTTADPIEGYEDELCRRHGYEACIRPVMFNYIRDIDIFRQNAAIAMGNSGDARHLPALRRAAAEGSEQVRRFAQIAIERLE